MQTIETSHIPPWERMGARVAAQLGDHPLMRDHATAPAVEASRFGVKVKLGTEAASVMRFQWYLPLTDERALRLASELAAQALAPADEAAA